MYIASLLGHSSLKTTQKYLHVEISDLKIMHSLYHPRENTSTYPERLEFKSRDLFDMKEYKPKIRKNGIGLPGYKEGWFKLKNGEKALLYVTDSSKVAYIPTNVHITVVQDLIIKIINQRT